MTVERYKPRQVRLIMFPDVQNIQKPMDAIFLAEFIRRGIWQSESYTVVGHSITTLAEKDGNLNIQSNPTLWAPA